MQIDHIGYAVRDIMTPALHYINCYYIIEMLD